MKRKRSKESLLVASSRRLVEAEVGLLDVVDFIEEVEVGAGFEESFHGGVVVEAVEAESAAAVVGVPAPREEREVLVQRAEIGLEHRRCEEGELRRRRRLRKAYVVDEGLQDLEGRRGVEGEVLRRNLQPGEDAVVDGRLRRRRQQAPVVGMSYRFAAAQIHKNRAVAAGELGSLARRDHRRPLLHRVEHRPRHLRRVAPAIVGPNSFLRFFATPVPRTYRGRWLRLCPARTRPRRRRRPGATPPAPPRRASRRLVRAAHLLREAGSPRSSRHRSHRRSCH
mmetsp:Transcript_19094/g.61453  ORF Transcript_19094/g.61453 Transcript_19094/m.61453 type:complete len:281 (-) Transcript_19094:396-1238(-)